MNTDGVPVSPTGTASLNVQVADSGDQPLAFQSADEPQPASVVWASYFAQHLSSWVATTSFSGDAYTGPYIYTVFLSDNDTLNWSATAGGSDHSYGHEDGDLNDYDGWAAIGTGPDDVASWFDGLPWEMEEESGVFTGDESAPETGSWSRNIQTVTMIVPGGQEPAGQTNLYLVLTSALAYTNASADDATEPVAPETMAVNGQPLADTDITNADGSVWGATLVSGLAGKPLKLITTATAAHFIFTNQIAKTKEDWQNMVRNEISVESGGIDINNYKASNTFLNNRPYIEGVYAFYQMVYLEQPTEYYWAGLAKLAGAPVYAGLSDAQNIGGLSDFQTAIMQMNIDILKDLAWQFEAYRQGGLQALEAIYAVDVNQTNLDLAAITAWRHIDQGIQQNNQALILSGNEALLSREQQQVLPPDYTQLSSFDTGLMSIFAKCPVWNSSDVPFPARDFDTIMTSLEFSSFNIANTDNRWTWITTPTFGIWDTWVNLSSDDKTSQVSTDLRTRAATYSTSSLFTLY